MTPLTSQDLEALKALAPGLIALAKAGDALREHYCESAACDMDGGRQQDILLESGVLVATPGGYSLERHGEQHEWGPEEGDDWHVETPSAYAARLQIEAGIIDALLSHITALEAEKAEARRLALEEAEQKCRDIFESIGQPIPVDSFDDGYTEGASDCADAIIALKERT